MLEDGRLEERPARPTPCHVSQVVAIFWMSFTCAPRRRSAGSPRDGRLRGRNPGGQIKARVQGPLQAAGGLRGVRGSTPLDLRRLLLLHVREEAGRRAGFASSREVEWLRLDRRWRSGPPRGASTWRWKEKPGERWVREPRQRVDRAVDGRVASTRGESF